MIIFILLAPFLAKTIDDRSQQHDYNGKERAVQEKLEKQVELRYNCESAEYETIRQVFFDWRTKMKI